MRIMTAVAIWSLIICSAAYAQEFKGKPWFSAARCSREDSVAADRDLDRLTNWAAIYRTFRLYKQCDDASIAEGYSDAVVILLTKDWPAVTELSRLTQSNPEFEQFVLLHVDSLISLDQAKTIIENAHNRCPVGSTRLCRRLEAKAKSPN